MWTHCELVAVMVRLYRQPCRDLARLVADNPELGRLSQSDRLALLRGPHRPEATFAQLLDQFVVAQNFAFVAQLVSQLLTALHRPASVLQRVPGGRRVRGSGPPYSVAP